MSAAQREARLKEAGLPLPDAFSAVLTMLMDADGECIHYNRLLTALADRMKFKEKRILAHWGSWENFVGDVLDQLHAAGLIASEDSQYRLTPAAVPGVPYRVLPDIGVTFWGKAERMAREANMLLAGELRRLSGRYVNADPGALLLLRKAVAALDAVVDPGKPPGPGRPRRPDRPEAKDLAREKYGYDGGVPMPRASRVFGPDGTRPCKQCGRDKDPDGFDVYMDNGKWYLHPTCNACRNEGRSRLR